MSAQSVALACCLTHSMRLGITGDQCRIHGDVFFGPNVGQLPEEGMRNGGQTGQG